MHLEAKITYQVELTAAEFRVMGLALAGKLKEKKDIEAALELNRRLLKGRADRLRESLVVAEGAMERAEEESGEGADANPI